MLIYHGSSQIIEVPQYGVGKPYNDYGMGFYCTENIEIAKEWSCSQMRNGFVNIYSIDMNELTVLNITKEYNVLNWLAILLENRTFDGLSELGYRAKEYYYKRKIRDQQARDDYKMNLKNISFNEKYIYIIDILRQEIKNNDQRLQ